MQVDKITLPAFWASALVNGDQSGMTTDDVIAMNRHMNSVWREGWSIVGCEDEPHFTWNYSLYGGDCTGGDVLEYTMIKRG